MKNLEGWQIENIFTIAITGLTIVGLYFAGAGGHSFWPFVLLMNLNTLRRN